MRAMFWTRKPAPLEPQTTTMNSLTSGGHRSLHRNIRRSPASQRGAATLIVVMVLFFVLSLVAAYTSRNLIFEQRTSANQYRSTQAFEAADAGVQWTLAMLNSGRIDANCLPSTDPTDSTFRDRYVPINADGTITLQARTAGAGALMPSCVFDAGTNGWSCRCPTDAAAAVPNIAGTAAKPMFRIRFEFIPLAESTRRDVVRIVSAGCTRPDAVCLTEAPAAPAGDAMALITQLVALKSGLSTPPGAAITAAGAIDAGTGPLNAINANMETNGITLHLGGAASGNTALTSLPGTPGSESIAQNDAGLSALTTGDAMFASVFGMAPAMYSQQPAVLRIDCSATCSASAVNTAAAANPGRMLWLDGNLTVDGNIGTAAAPALVVVAGTATLTSGTVFGLIYGRVAGWNRGAGNTTLNGALIAEGALTGSGSQTIVYDFDLVSGLRARNGSFVAVPGGWRDF